MNDSQDYQNFLSERGMTDADVKQISGDVADVKYYPSNETEVRMSLIEGFGLFATADLHKGSKIMPARIGETRTQAGRFVNHSAKPNAQMIAVDGDIVLMAIADIAPGTEITINYRQSESAVKLAHRQKLAALEKSITDSGQAIELPVKHHFAHGTYVRELEIPAGVVLTGKIHRYSCTNMLIKGRVKVVSDEGEIVIIAPAIFKTGPDVKKAIAAIEDSIFINVHPWNGTDDLDAIESKLIIDASEALESQAQEKSLCHG
jgi:hypothetical protein